jgi:asparagine synthase (glutamine-hydrolysing)
MSPHDLTRLATHGVSDDVGRRWAGSYVVVELTDDETCFWTDLSCAVPLYYLRLDGGTMWASSPRALAGLTGHEIDTQRLAASLLIPATPAAFDHRSMFAGISLFPAGHRVSLTNQGVSRMEPVWQPQPRSGEPAARLRVELTAAVSVRVESAASPTADLSGGLDSTALTLIAAERLSPNRTVAGVTVHPPDVVVEGDMLFAREAAAHPGVVHHLFPLDPADLPYGRLEAVPVADEPAPSTIAYSRFSAQLERMRSELGSDCHMTGDGGDSLLSPGSEIICDLLVARRYRRVWAEAVALARLRRTSVWSSLAGPRRMQRIDRSTALTTLARIWRSEPVTEVERADVRIWFPSVGNSAWATPGARELAASLAVTSSERLGTLPPRLVHACMKSEVVAEVGRSARADAQLAEYNDVPLHNPFLDSRVVDAYLSIPLDQHPGPADYKPLLRRAMAGLFPSRLADRTTKGTFTSDFYEGMRVHSANLSALADGHLAVMGLIDPAQFRQTLALAAAGLAGPFSSIEPVVAAEVWLRSLHAGRAVKWIANTEGEKVA